MSQSSSEAIAIVHDKVRAELVILVWLADVQSQNVKDLLEAETQVAGEVLGEERHMGDEGEGVDEHPERDKRA